MKLLFGVLFGALCSLSLSAQTGQVEWLTWEEAYEKQKQEPRKIFIDLYTDWCGWCKKMDQTTFKNPEVVKILNEMYYPVKFDAERSDTIVFNDYTFVNPNPGGRRSTHMFAASLLENQLSYPSFTILDENFTRVHIIKGYQRVPQLKANLLFFGTDQHRRYMQYLNDQDQRNRSQQQSSEN